MIIETKRWQFVFTILGLSLIGIDGYTLFNFTRFYLIMLHETSPGIVIFNKIASIIIMLTMIAIGILILWVVKYSIIECRKFRDEKQPSSISAKGIIRQIIWYTIILSLMAGGLFMFNRFAADCSPLLKFEKHEPPREARYISCTADIISYHEKDSHTISPEWDNYTGISTLKIITPERYQGKIIKFKLAKELPSGYPLKQAGATCKLVISNKYLNRGAVILKSDNIISIK